jgi:HlyD family secretion protein
MDDRQILSEAERIELLSEDVQEIMGRVPPWLVRWGVTVVFVILMGLIVGSILFKFPDVITSTVVILSENPPASIVARSTGCIQQLYVHNAQFVKEGQVLAVIENTARYEDVAALEGQLREGYEGFVPREGAVLGPLQSSFSAFSRQYAEYRTFVSLGLLDQKIASARERLRDYQGYVSLLQAQASNIEQTLQIARGAFQRDSLLFASASRGGLTPAEYDQSRQGYLQSQNSRQSFMASLASGEMELRQLRYQVADLQSQQKDQQTRLQSALKEAYDNLKAALAAWQQTYLLVSPMDGKVTFTRYWSANQQVTGGEVVFSVVPRNPRRIVGRIELPISGSGKAQVGQKVHIKLDNFPYTEFGMLEGKVESISLVPLTNTQGTFYTVEVSLPEGLTTNYGKTLPLNQQMQGAAEIITNYQSLFDRLIQPLKSALSKLGT